MSAGRARSRYWRSVSSAFGTDRHDPLLGALAVGDQHAGLEVELAELQRDRFGGAQATGIHRFEQGAIAQRRMARALRLGEQAVDLIAAEHAR